MHIVEGLEPVDIDYQQRDGCIVANGASPLLIERIIECATIGNPGKRIDDRKPS